MKKQTTDKRKLHKMENPKIMDKREKNNDNITTFIAVPRELTHVPLRGFFYAWNLI